MKFKFTPVWILKNLEEILASAALAVMILVNSANVFARYLFHSPFSWADEVCMCMLAWVSFVGSAAAFKRNLHFGMDFIIGRFPGNGKHWARCVITGLIGLIAAFLTWQAIWLTLNAVKVMPYSRLSYKYLDASAIVGFASMTLYSVRYCIMAVREPALFDERYEAQDQQGS